MFTAHGVHVMKDYYGNKPPKLVRSADTVLMSEGMAYLGFIAGILVAVCLLFL